MTTNLLIFFAIPFAIIVISIALQKILNSPVLVASIIFSILLIVVLAFFDTVFLIAVVVYTFLSFLTALLACLICRRLKNRICNMICNGCNNEESFNNQMVISSLNDNTGTTDENYTCISNNFGNINSYKANNTNSIMARGYNCKR